MNVTIQPGKDGKPDQLVIRLSINKEGTPSATGKTIVHASSRGNKPTGMDVNGHDLIVGVNAYSYPEE